jgi:hypothetical protein
MNASAPFEAEVPRGGKSNIRPVIALGMVDARSDANLTDAQMFNRWRFSSFITMFWLSTEN